MKLFSKHTLLGLFVFLLVLVITASVVRLVYQLRKANESNRINAALHDASFRLKDDLTESYAVANTLSYQVESYGFPKSLDVIGREILKAHKSISAVELVDSGTIKMVYPLIGNEAVIGYDILKDSNRNLEAFKTIEKRKMFFAGPFNLKQGGVGIVGRMPIFKDSSFIGFSAVVIYLDSLLKHTGIYPSLNTDVEFQLTKHNPNSGKEESFVPIDDFDLKLEKYQLVELPMGEWKLYARAKSDRIFWSLVPLSIAGLILAMISGLFSWYLARQPELLKKLVDEKVKKLNRNEKLLSLTQDSAKVGSWAADYEKGTVFWTETCRSIYGIEDDDAYPDLITMIAFCPMENHRKILEDALRRCFNDGVNFDVDVKIRRVNGKEIWVRIIGCRNLEEEKSVIYGATQDINDHIKSENEKMELLDSIGDAFVACDDVWNVTFWNQAASDMFKVSSGEIKGQNLLDYISTDTKQNILEEFMKAGKEANGYSFEFFSTKLEIWCEVILYKKSHGFSAYIRDVTSKHIYIHKIEEQNKRLKEIAWMQSHVVRAPIAKLLGSVELLKVEKDAEGRTYLLNVIKDSSLEMDKIIRDITSKTEVFDNG